MTETNSSSSTLTQHTIEQIRCALSEITQLAFTAKHLCIETVMNEEDKSCVLSNANQAVVEKIGFLADLCLGKMGHFKNIGDAEDWMCSPAYHEAVTTKAD